MEEIIISRMKTPEDKNGNRKLVDPLTSSDAVIISNSKKTLTKRLEEITDLSSRGGIIIADEENKPDGPCIWGKILSVKDVEV